MSQRQQLERILEIDRRIRAGEYPNPNRLAAEMEVSRRVIFSDREFMVSRLGAPICFDRRYNGWYYSDPVWMLPAVMVTEGELLAFFLSIEAARRYLGTALESPLRSAIDKIGKTINGPVSIDLETLRRHYTFAAPALTSVDEQTLLGLHTGIVTRRKVWMRYYTASRDAHTERVVDPYHLYNSQGDWYLVAFDERRQEVRSFLAGRIEEWKLSGQTFVPDPNFSIGAWMKGAFRTERGGDPVEVVIRFDAHQARYIRERRWHESQKVEELAGGGLILRFQIGGLNEVLRWVMQYGSHAEVLEPAELREQYKLEVGRMQQIYEDGRG